MRALRLSAALSGLPRSGGRPRSHRKRLDAARQALAVYEESLALLQSVGDKVGIAQCLEGMAYTVCALGQPARAPRLLGAAAALRDTVGAPLPPRDRPRYHHHVATAQRALGDHGYAEGWAAGQQFPLDQTIAYALSPVVPA